MAQQETFEIHVVDDGPPASDDVNFPFTFDMVCEGEYLGSQTLDVKVPKDLAAKCEAACAKKPRVLLRMPAKNTIISVPKDVLPECLQVLSPEVLARTVGVFVLEEPTKKAE